MELFEKKKDADFARQIFSAWDVRGEGFLTFQEVTT
jgi:hypothetical protein